MDHAEIINGLAIRCPDESVYIRPLAACPSHPNLVRLRAQKLLDSAAVKPGPFLAARCVFAYQFALEGSGRVHRLWRLAHKGIVRPPGRRELDLEKNVLSPSIWVLRARVCVFRIVDEAVDDASANLPRAKVDKLGPAETVV